jgi:glutathione S-transferase
MQGDDIHSQREELLMKLYFDPLSSYSQKVLIAFYEKGVAFSPEMVDMFNPAARAEYLQINPLGKVPTLVLDDGHRIPESTIIVEYLEDEFGSSGTRLIQEDRTLARQTRFYDRLFDLYINDPMTTIFFDGTKPEAAREPGRVAAAKAKLDTLYPQLDKHFAGRTWAVGDTFTMADCAAAPTLIYAKMVYPYESHRNLVAYAGRLAERPSVARVLSEAAPYMARFQAAAHGG